MKKRPVYPVEGRFLQGVPHVEHDCDDPHCTDSGAFTATAPPTAVEPEPTDPPEGGSSDSKED